MIFVDYQGKIMYSDSEGSVFLGKVDKINDERVFVATRDLHKVALGIPDLMMVARLVKEQ
jgi:hypothetical protein